MERGRWSFFPCRLFLWSCGGHIDCRTGNHSVVHLFPGAILVPKCAIYARAPFQCLYVPKHHCRGNMCPGTILVLICVRTPIQCPYLPGYNFVADICLGTILVPIWTSALFQWPYMPRQHFGANMCPGTIPVHIYAQAPFRCPCTPRHQSSVYLCLGTLSVPKCSRAPFWCLLVSGYHIRFSYVPGYHSDAHMCPGNTPVPIFI